MGDPISAETGGMRAAAMASQGAAGDADTQEQAAYFAEDAVLTGSALSAAPTSRA